MKREDQFSTLDQSLRLVDLGVKPEALFWHIKAKSEKHGESIVYGWTSDAIAPAYGVAELGDMLAASTTGMNLWATTSYGGAVKYWEVTYQGRIWGVYITEAHARATLLIRLLEGAEMKLPEPWRQNPDDAAELHKVKVAKEAM